MPLNQKYTISSLLNLFILLLSKSKSWVFLTSCTIRHIYLVNFYNIRKNWIPRNTKITYCSNLPLLTCNIVHNIKKISGEIFICKNKGMMNCNLLLILNALKMPLLNVHSKDIRVGGNSSQFVEQNHIFDHSS